MGFAGLSVLLVAKFNDRYHRTGGALSRALQSLGATVTPCEERTRGLDRLLGWSLERRLGVLLERSRPDLVLVFKGGLLPADVIDRLRPRARARWANWWPDSPHLLDLSLSIGRAYDHCFVFDTSMVDRHRAAGHRASYLAEGCEPEYHRPLPDLRWPRARIAFVGSREPRRVATLAALEPLGISVWGPDWPRGPLYGDDFVKAFSNADVALNLHQFFEEPAERGWYGTGANRRTFELAAIGTVQLCDAKADVLRHFRPDQEIVLYRSSAELVERARWLLGDPDSRAGIGARGRTRALAEHTWRHRVAELLSEALR